MMFSRYTILVWLLGSAFAALIVLFVWLFAREQDLVVAATAAAVALVTMVGILGSIFVYVDAQRFLSASSSKSAPTAVLTILTTYIAMGAAFGYAVRFVGGQGVYYLGWVVLAMFAITGAVLSAVVVRSFAPRTRP